MPLRYEVRGYIQSFDSDMKRNVTLISRHRSIHSAIDSRANCIVAENSVRGNRRYDIWDNVEKTYIDVAGIEVYSQETAPKANRESSIVTSIQRYLDTYKPDLFYEKTHGGMFGAAGKPDITGCYYGRRFEIEVKLPGEKPRPNQEARMQKWRDAGAFVIVAYSVDDVINMMEQIRSDQCRIRIRV